ncbi:hypothetical protein F5B21DRAFT_347488 [Xylaria acuta]|nr:hypothetical protein F5B21DRAFT_347488 [Xylaria acuta]
MKIQVSSVKLNIRSGDEIELLPSNTAVNTCIVPQRQLLLQGPQAIIDAFENETGMSSIRRYFGLHWSSYLYEDENIFDGDMIISMSSIQRSAYRITSIWCRSLRSTVVALAFSTPRGENCYSAAGPAARIRCDAIF